MTLPEWTAEVTEDFRAAGYTVTEMGGFPIVAMPADVRNGASLIKFQGRWACEKRLYAEGMLLVPVGTPGNPTPASDTTGSVKMNLSITKRSNG